MGSLTNASKSVTGGAGAASSGVTKNSSGSPDDRNKSTPAPAPTKNTSTGKVSSAGSVATGARSVINQGDTGTKSNNSSSSSSSSSSAAQQGDTGTRNNNGSGGISAAAQQPREVSTLGGRANGLGDSSTFSQLDDWLNDTTIPSRSISQIRAEAARAKGYDPYDAEAQTPGSNSWSDFQDMVSTLSPNRDNWDALHGAGTAAIPKGVTADQWAQMQHVPLQQLDEWRAAHGDGHNVSLSTSMMPEDPQGFVDFNRELGNFGTLNWKGRPQSTNIEDRTQGAPAVPGGFDLAALAHSLNGPYLKRVEQNQGVAPFEGPVDTAGIVRALNAPYYRAHSTPGPMDPLGSGHTWQQMQDYITNPNTSTSLGEGNTAPSGVRAPTRQPTQAELQAIRAWNGPTGEHFNAPSANPNARDAPYTPSQELQTNAYLGEGNTPALDGIAAAVDPATGIPLPRRDPRGYDSLFSSDGQVTTPDGSVVTGGREAPPNVFVGKDGRTYRRDFTDDPLLPGGTTYHTDGTGARTLGDAPKSKWDEIVDNGGKILSHTGLGGIVSGLFPDLWNAGGDMMKGLDNGGGGQPIDNVAFTNLINGGRDPFMPQNNADGSSAAAPAAAAVAPFPDVNHNGIDDRLEGLGATDATGFSGNQFRSNRYATFPDMSPYRPGVDDEWNYFHDHLARGGVVGYADRDPRVSMIADAEDALHRGDHGHPSLDKFVDTFGPKALENLNNNVRAGYRMRAGRVVSGPGGPTDDAVPAVIDGQHPAKLSSGEFVVPVSAVEGIGGGDAKAGADRLHQLVERFAK